MGRLIKFRKQHKGRDKKGRITVRHKGGGAKQKYRRLTTLSGTAKVLAIEYDPNRTAKIALIEKDGQKQYILAPEKLVVGQEVIQAEKTPIRPANRMKLVNIPIGTSLYDLELLPHGGAKIVRSAGNQAIILAKDEKFAHLKLPSGEVRKFFLDSYASIGQVSGVGHSLEKFHKAGDTRHRSIRPTVRGKAMHPAAHPHGGGEGVNPIGLKYPKTPWGKPARGVRTRRKYKLSAKFIISRRKK